MRQEGVPLGDAFAFISGLYFRGKLAYADAFAAALARLRKAELVTGDPDFKAVEGEIRIGWLK